MTTQHRKFTVEQKLHLLQEAEQMGVAQTLRKHNLSHSVLSRWRKQLSTGGAAGLTPHYPKVDAEKKALELEFKTELLKKAASLHLRK